MSEQPNIRKLISKAANAYLAEMRGEFCQCAEPQIGAGIKATLCWACGRYNQEAKRRVGAAMRAKHPFKPMGEGPIRSRYCDFCAHLKEDKRHEQS